jgi:hypothetical protein
LIVFGAFIAGARDLSFDAYGYAIVFLSNITTAIYLATIARVGCIITSPSLSILNMSFSQEKLVALIALVLCGAMVSRQICPVKFHNFSLDKRMYVYLFNYF